MKERAGKLEGQKEGKTCSISQQSQEYSSSSWSQQCDTQLYLFPYTNLMLWALVVQSHPALHPCAPVKSQQPKGHWESINGILELKPMTFTKGKQGISKNYVCYRGIHISTDSHRGLHHHEYFPEFGNNKNAENQL